MTLAAPLLEKKDPKTATTLLLVASFVEGIFTLTALLSIPTDPKNAIFGGFSLTRLVIIAGIILGLVLFLFLLIQKRFAARILTQWAARKHNPQVTNFFSWIAFIIFWLVSWLPAFSLGVNGDNFTRLQPVLIWVSLIAIQILICLKYLRGEIRFNTVLHLLKEQKRAIAWTFGIAFAVMVLFLLLPVIYTGSTENKLYFPPSAPLSALQVFGSWIVISGIITICPRRLDAFFNKAFWTATIFMLLWAAASLTWSQTPLACTDDRPGPYAPNGVCYPSVNDAVYSIGSHYIGLGQGIYHHWMTDKPLYMAFLALGQQLFGELIDDYLKFQILILAIVPGLLFILGWKLGNRLAGFFSAVLFILVEMNNIVFYRQVGGVNVRLENPEVLTALLLVLFTLAFYFWLASPSRHGWAIGAGSLLALATLTRFNAALLVPLCAVVFGAVYWKKKKAVVVNLALFGLSFMLVFGPWLFLAQDELGRNMYWTKIQNVLQTRYGADFTTNGAQGSGKSGNEAPLIVSTPQPPTERPTQESHLTYQQEIIEPSGYSEILLHFLNNEYTALSVLPVNITLLDGTAQINQSIWSFIKRAPLWNLNLSVENIATLAISSLIVIAGIASAIKKVGAAGIAPLITQVGYHLGNALSKTSGSRYLEPVNWVFMLYFAIGLVVITKFAWQIFSARETETSPQSMPQSDQKHIFLPTNRFTVAGLLLCSLAIGAVLPIINQLPNQLPLETSSELTEAARRLVLKSGVTEEAWHWFISEPNALVVQGKAYHPRFYKSGFFNQGNESFEIMALGKDHVLVSYLLNGTAQGRFTDGSDVIMVGCKIGTDSLWGANRIIMQSYFVFQMDGEQGIYRDSEADLRCED